MCQNPMCDGNHCGSSQGEVRLLPLGSDGHHGNLILCRSCHRHELTFRRDRNREFAEECKFDLPEWSTLEIYGDAS